MHVAPLVVLLACLATLSTTARAQAPAFNCHAAHGNAALCHRAAFQGCFWTAATSQCTKIQFCAGHIASSACTADWNCRWWANQCQPVIPGDITTIGADQLCASFNSDLSTSFVERRRQCIGQTRCEWDHAALQCKTDRNVFALSASVTEGRCVQDGTAAWHQPLEGCYDPLHPGLHSDVPHTAHSICPPGVCFARGRCDPNVVCRATTADACNAFVGNCRWDASAGRCKAQSLVRSMLDDDHTYERVCADASFYSAHLMNLRLLDVGPRKCPDLVPGTGLANCTVKSDCQAKIGCSYDAVSNTCGVAPAIVCHLQRCATACTRTHRNCHWNSQTTTCVDNGSPVTPVASSTGGSGGDTSGTSSGTAGDDDEGDTQPAVDTQLGFLKWRYHWSTGGITGIVTMPLQWSCTWPVTPYLAIRSNSKPSLDAQKWECTTIQRAPNFPTYLPCGDAYRRQAFRQLASSHTLTLPNQTAYQPLNRHGIAHAIDFLDSPDTLAYDVHVNLFNHSIATGCTNASTALVDYNRRTVGVGSFVEFTIPFRAAWLNKFGQMSSSDFDLHTLLYGHRDSVQFIVPVQVVEKTAADDNNNNTTTGSTAAVVNDATVQFSLVHVGFASNASTSCKHGGEKAIQQIYLIEVDNVVEGTTSGPRFLSDIALVSPCHSVTPVRLVSLGCSNGSCAYYLVTRTECRSTSRTTHNNTWAPCQDKGRNGSLVLHSTILVQLWTCVGKLSRAKFSSHFEDDSSLCITRGVRYAQSSVAIDEDALWVNKAVRFDINMVLLRTPESPLSDVLQKEPLSNVVPGDVTSLPMPVRAVLTETALTVAVFFDNAVSRTVLDLSIVPESIALIGVDSLGRDVEPKLTLPQVLHTLSALPKQLTPNQDLRLPACKPYAGCDGFVARTRQLQAILPSAVFYRVELSVQLNSGVNGSSPANSSTPEPSGKHDPAARRLLQDADGDYDYDSGETITEIDTSTTVGNTTVNETIIIITDGDITIIDIEITNGTSHVFAEIIIDTSELDAIDRRSRATDVLVIVFFVVLGLALFGVCICVAYFWLGQANTSSTSQPFALTGSKQSLDLYGVAGRANLHNMPPRIIVTTRAGGYQRLPTTEM